MTGSARGTGEGQLRLTVLAGRFAVCRLEAGAVLPAWALRGDLCSVTRTSEELSVVCPQEGVPAGVPREAGWVCLKVEGPLDFSLTGILASLAGPLAQAGIPLFALSTYDTDYLLVREDDLPRAIAALSGEGHQVGQDKLLPGARADSGPR